MTIQEGGYCEKPAMCSDIAPARAHADLLDLEVCYFDPTDPVAIADKLVEFVSNIGRYRASAIAASAKIKSLDESYLGRCYSEVLAYAAGLNSKPVWMPFCRPNSWG